MMDPKKDASHRVDCVCALCASQKPFSFPPDLIESFMGDKMTIFAGAGISTEGMHVIGHTLYDEIKTELPQAKENDFPSLVSEFCKMPNGRLQFITKLHKRIRYVETSPEFFWYATRFHRALSPICKIHTIITTNWDHFFESECWATPFVYPEDNAFWSAAERRVLKIHGSIENLGSIVASSEDYIKCETRLETDLIGSRLKLLLSETTVVFCGYSLRDPDFREIMKFVRNQMQGFNRQPYIVTIDETKDSANRFSELGIVPIYTDATYFLEELYAKWRENGCVAPKSVYAGTADLLQIVREEHVSLSEQISMFDNARVLYSLFYQDGLIHALDRIKSHERSGEYSDLHRVQAKIRGYNELRKKSSRLRRYDDTAYIEGYLAALIFVVCYKEDEDEIHPPLYFDFPNEVFYDFEEYKEHIADTQTVHKSSLKFADKIVSRYHPTPDFVLDHSFHLRGVM